MSPGTKRENQSEDLLNVSYGGIFCPNADDCGFRDANRERFDPPPVPLRRAARSVAARVCLGLGRRLGAVARAAQTLQIALVVRAPAVNRNSVVTLH